MLVEEADDIVLYGGAEMAHGGVGGKGWSGGGQKAHDFDTRKMVVVAMDSWVSRAGNRRQASKDLDNRCVAARLFADAEVAEDFVEDVFDVHAAGDAAEGLGGAAEMFGHYCHFHALP